MRDSIKDFSLARGDRIGLAALDANVGLVGNQTFSFIGTAAFSGVSGQLHIETAGNVRLVTADVQGDRLMDSTIFIDDPITMNANGFVL